MDILNRAEHRRVETLASLDETQQVEQGQFFTPMLAAQIIASLPALPEADTLRVLDPGAGSGMLTAALVARLGVERPDIKVSVVAIEADPALLPSLEETLSDCTQSGVETTLVHADFIEWALTTSQRFDLVIQNPPYAKLKAKSRMDLTLKEADIVVPNIYAAFVALGERLLTEGGQQVAITPRSWMNGSYYSAFRHALLRTSAMAAIHTFESRSKVFGDTGVLQETVVFCTKRGCILPTVRLSVSHDHRTGMAGREVPYAEVHAGDYVFIPVTEAEGATVQWMARANESIASLGLTVSTGKVVDFRSRKMLLSEPTADTVPMVYPSHFVSGRIEHPQARVKKPQWFDTSTPEARKLVLPAGTYVLIKRFSAKEEKRRVVAALWQGEAPPAFDNKTNYIHANGAGLTPELAEGLVRWLNSGQVDAYFRVFSGHTQVNAGDLRKLPFPTHDELLALATCDGDIDQVVGRQSGEAA